MCPATRLHEVVIHFVDHHARFESLSSERRLGLMRTYRTRPAAAALPCMIAASTRGREAGAFRSHEHAQTVGLDQIAPTLPRESEATSQACVVCALREENAPVARQGGGPPIAHPVPFVAHELLPLPACSPWFQEACDEEVYDLAWALAEPFPGPDGRSAIGLATNFVAHTAPPRTDHFP